MNQSLDLASIGKSISNFFGRFHAILFLILIAGAITYCMFSIISIIDLSSRADASSKTISSSFDQKTIERVDQLESRDKNTPIDIPTNQRVNPFVD